jgi:hypothetical protein
MGVFTGKSLLARSREKKLGSLLDIQSYTYAGNHHYHSLESLLISLLRTVHETLTMRHSLFMSSEGNSRQELLQSATSRVRFNLGVMRRESLARDETGYDKFEAG